MKKVFMNFLLICFILNFFSFDIFAQEIIIVDSENNLYEQTLKEYDEFSSLLKKYFTTGKEDFLINYSVHSDDFYSVENSTNLMQPYVVSESLFYWNYFRNNIEESESKRKIDDNVISFWNYINENSVLDDQFLIVYNYAKSFASFANVQFQLPIDNFKITDFGLEKNDNAYKLLSEVFVRNDFYQSLSKAEGMLYKLNKNREVLDVQMALSEKTFYEVLNNPKLLYVIFNNEKYLPIKDSFDKSANMLLNVQIISNIDFYNVKSLYSFLPEDIYNKIYLSLPDTEKLFDVTLQYEFINYFSKFTLKQLKEGFELSYFFTSSELELYNKILENNYYAFCVDLDFINTFIDKVKIILSLDYSTSLIISNLKIESGDYE